MIETEVFQKSFVGRDGFIWWIGQIASDSFLQNQPGSSAKDIDTPGFDYRYQVRIMGYHTADKNTLTDDQLPWASVVLPVTAGGGGGNAVASPSLEKGNYVYGFFLDGEDGQQPVIMGIMGYNKLMGGMKGGVPPVGFTPFLGFNYDDRVGKPTTAIPEKVIKKPKPSAEAIALAEDTGRTIEEAQQILGEGGLETVIGADGSGQLKNLEEKKEIKTGTKKIPLKKPNECDRSPLGMQTTIQNLIQDVQGVQESLVGFRGDVYKFQGEVIQYQQYINLKLQTASKNISGWIKDKLDDVFKWIVKKLGDAMKPILANLHPDQSQDVKSIFEYALELLVCAFKKIIDNILNMVINALTEVLNRWINVPLCAAENILSAIIGKLMGLVNGIVNMISGVINGVLGALGQAIDIVGDVLGFLDALLSIFDFCAPEKAECPKVSSWSLWDGSDTEENPFDVSRIIDKVKHFASGVSDVVDPDNFDFDADMDFSDVWDISGCDTGPRFCGPPELVFWGGSGNGALGNAIISEIGDAIGVDIVNTGHGYDKEPPYLRFNDDCGRGHGAMGVPSIGPVSPIDLQPYRAKRQNINKQPNISPDDWELITISTDGLPIWDPSITYYGERTIRSAEIEYVSANENENLKVLYADPEKAVRDGFQPAAGIGTLSIKYDIIPADIVAYSPKWIADPNGTDTGVTGITMMATGFDYLPAPDGSKGGDGRTWAEYDDTTLRHSDGTYDLPYSSGEIIAVQEGDTICTPLGSVSAIYTMDGDSIELSGGCNTVSADGIVTAPTTNRTPRQPKNTYPIVLYVCEALILNPGFGYQEGDEVVIEPSHGAEITPIFGPYGNLISLKIIKGGEGFQQMPVAYIKSDTGINAEIGIRMCIDRIGDEVKEPPSGEKIISVVDCVGKV